MDKFRGWITAGVVVAMMGVSAVAIADSKKEDVSEANELLVKSTDTLNDLLKTDSPDKGIPREMFEHAKAVGVFPKVVSAAMGMGGRHGEGVITVKQADGKWGPPAMFALTGGSAGLQIGVETTELVLFFMTDGSVKSLLDSKVTLGGKAGIAAGPVGRSAEAATDLKLHAEIYSYAKSKGLFAGISFEGAKLAADKDDNQHVFGTSKTENILYGKVAEMPQAAQSFLAALPPQQ
jgi:lipid-binding SYLF domain-containing protein